MSQSVDLLCICCVCGPGLLACWWDFAMNIAMQAVLLLTQLQWLMGAATTCVPVLCVLLDVTSVIIELYIQQQHPLVTMY